MLNTNLTLVKRRLCHPAIECLCWLHTWPTLLQSVCKYMCNIVRIGLTASKSFENVDDGRQDACIYCNFYLVSLRLR